MTPENGVDPMPPSRKPLDRAEDAIRLVVGAALMLMVIGITLDAVGRYLFGSSLPGAMRITEMFLMPAVVFLSWGAAQRHRKHVAVDILHGRLRGGTARIVNRVIDLLGLVLFVLVLWTAAGYALDYRGRWTVEFPSLPSGPSRAIVVVGAAFMVLRLGAQFAGRREEPVDEQDEPSESGEPGKTDGED